MWSLTDTGGLSHVVEEEVCGHSSRNMVVEYTPSVLFLGHPNVSNDIFVFTVYMPSSVAHSYMPSSVAQRVFVVFTGSCKTRIFATSSAHHEHRKLASIARA